MTGRSLATPRWRTLAILALLALAAESASAQRAATRSAQAIPAEYPAVLPHYALLLVLGQPIESRPPVSHGALLGEAALARAASGDRTEAARMLREALARSWGDTAVRHALAVVLAGGDELDGALAQYDTLLAPSAPRVEPRITVASGAPPASGGRHERTAPASLLAGGPP